MGLERDDASAEMRPGIDAAAGMRSEIESQIAGAKQTAREAA